MTLGERVKAIRKEKGLTQQEFGDLIGIKRNSVALIEGGRATSDQTVNSICRVFNVREEWLRDGVGSMFEAPEPEPLDVLLKSREIPKEDLSVVKSVVRAFLELEKPSRDAVIQFVQSCAEKLNATDEAPSADDDLAEKVAALERQNRELMERLEAIEKDDAEKEKAGETLGASPASRYR